MGTTLTGIDLVTRLQQETSIYKAVMANVGVGIRVAMPCKIMAFNAEKQTVTARPMITENVMLLTDAKTFKRTLTPKQIPDLLDVPLLVYSDSSFAITLPNIVGAECLVIFADLCINSWWANGPATDSNGNVSGQNQERRRRHSLSDGFAVLSPKSNPAAIQNYSTTALQIRSLDGNAVFSIDESDNISLATTDGNITLQVGSSGNIQINGPTVSAATYANISASVPVQINGVTYYIKLSTSP